MPGNLSFQMWIKQLLSCFQCFFRLSTENHLVNILNFSRGIYSEIVRGVNISEKSWAKQNFFNFEELLGKIVVYPDNLSFCFRFQPLFQFFDTVHN